jgi:uncharacterized surface protein with fasciclin (FAS1) repeats
MTKRLVMAGLVAAMAATGSAQEKQEKTVMVGGESMFPSKNIIANAINSKDHTTLVAAVKAGGLVETLQGAGPFTVFAPTNAAFAKLPAGTIDTLLKAENKPTLVKILTYHVVAGTWDADALLKKVRDGGGTAELTTVSGGKLWAVMNGSKNIALKDERGTWAEISTYDVLQMNGVIHVITNVLMPR